MCGIIGTFQARLTSNTLHESALQQWLNTGIDALYHRGPDAGNIITEENIGLGARRLRVHDCDARSDQPFEDPSGRYVAVYNGAIFNFQSIRQELKGLGITFQTSGDTEVAINALIVWGKDAFARFDGMFSIALLDRKLKTLLIGRDKLGIKPLYIHRHDSFIAFSSEIKPLLAHPYIDIELNIEAVPEFFAFQYISPPNTLFNNISVFSPGCYCELSTGNDGEVIAKETKYWEINHKMILAPDALPVKDALEVSLRRCWNADRSAGVQLSGGVDSTLICALTEELQLSKNTYETYSVVFNDRRGKYYLPRSEERYIQQVASRYNLPNKSYLFTDGEIRAGLAEAIWYNEMPLLGASSTLYMLLAKRLQNDVTVLLTGEGADDIFLGYFDDWRFSDNKESLYKFFIKPPLIKDLFGHATYQSIIDKREKIIDEPRLEGMSLSQKASVVTIETYLHGLLARHDRMFMSHSIEGRPPFCTDEMLKARFSMDDNLIHDGYFGKKVLKDLVSRYFGEDFAYRKKIGFSVSFGDWCASPQIWNEYVKAIDLEFLAEFMNVDVIRRQQNMPEGKDKWSQQNLNLIFSAAQFQLWYDIFFNSQNPIEKTSWESRVPSLI